MEHELDEFKTQTRFVSWCRQNGIFVFAIANQQPMAACCDDKTTVKRILKKLYKSGLEEGMPDLMVPIPSNGYHGLFIEMKKKSGKLAKRQKAIMEWLEKMRYKAVTCHTTEDAIAQTKKYLNL